MQVDGNDIIAVHHAMQHALEKARGEKGPTLIEALTYRICDHTTADDARRYIPQEEYQAAFEFEPLKRLRVYLEKNNCWSEEKEKTKHSKE